MQQKGTSVNNITPAPWFISCIKNVAFILLRGNSSAVRPNYFISGTGLVLKGFVLIARENKYG